MNGGSRNSSSNVISGGTPGIRQRIRRPSIRVWPRRTERAASHSRAAEAEDLARGAAAIEDATGSRVRWHRPPYGIYSGSGLAAAREAKLDPLLWSRWGKDWRKFTTPGRIAARATRAVSAGDVILLHDADFYSARDSHLRTEKALPAIINELKRLGLDTVLPV